MTGRLSGSVNIGGNMTIPAVVPPPTYEGAYEVTPGDEAVTLETEGLVMEHDVIVSAIPSNHGKVTYDGSTLTVS